MASSADVLKRRAWETRFAKYHASGLSVARFCQQERVSTHTFYYWAKRLKQVSAQTTAWGEPRLLPRRDTAPPPTESNVQQAVVRFRWQSGAEVWVPAECREAIRCLAECFVQAGERHAAAFQEVVLKK
jgi:hypothetical protein